MAHCSIYVKMEKGPQPGKFSLTAVLLTFSDLSHSQQTKTLSSGSHTLLLLLSQILVNYTYKFFYRNSVNHASLFQRLHLRRRASDAVHSSAH